LMRARRRERETMVMRNEAGRKKGECHCRCHIATAVAVSMGLVACDRSYCAVPILLGSGSATRCYTLAAGIRCRILKARWAELPMWAKGV